MVNQESTTKFYTDGKITIKVKPGEEVPDGFHLGRTFNSKPWNKGLTAETDERIKQNGIKTRNTRIATGSYENPWNKGKTKETDAILQTVSDKVSQARQNKFWASTAAGTPKSEEQKQKQSIAMQGGTPWNKGLSKETDDRVASASNKLLGHECFVKDWTLAKQKEYITKKLHNSFNTSKPEMQYKTELESLYGSDNVISQYQDKRYKNPKTGVLFNCDFYILSEDLFIELNYTWFHGAHPFNIDNQDDFNKLTELQYKATNEPEKTSYLYAIKVWTELDPMKLNELRKNKLNFLILYPNGLVIDK